MIKVNSSNVEFITFSDGCENVVLPLPRPFEGGDTYHISVEWEDCTRDIVRIMLTVDAIRRKHNATCNISLVMPYIPNARADRVFEKGNALPIKVFADMINSCGFTDVYVQDPHSAVAPALINNVREMLNCYVSHQIRNRVKEGFVLCAPDIGASKKVASYGVEYIQAHKERDIMTGQISNIKVDCNGHKKVVIVDDICDGGGTFIGLAEELKSQGATEVILIVTHGIFSKGLEVFEGLIDHIYYTNLICNYVTAQDIKQFNGE